MGSANNDSMAGNNNGENNGNTEQNTPAAPATETTASTTAQDTGGSVGENVGSDSMAATPLAGASESNEDRVIKVSFSGLFKGEREVPVGTTVQEAAKLFTDQPMSSLTFREEGNGNRAVAASRRLEGDITVVSSVKGEPARANIGVAQRASGG